MMAINIDMTFLRSLESRPRGERLLEAALAYARNGGRVVPVLPNSKLPAIEDWSTFASKDPATINRWFGPDGAHREGNISLLVEGFSVVDIDRHGDVDGFKTLNGVTSGIACPRAMTPNDGEHLIASKTDLKDAPGVEILSTGKLFTVYPSEIDGKRYMWKMGGVPSPVFRLKLVEEKPTLPGAMALAPAPYVQSLLDFIEPDCDYRTWLNVGMAIHHNDAGELGLELWDDWSRLGRKYKEGECEKRWASFDADRGKPVTMRWLIIEAIKNGKPQNREDVLYHGNLQNSVEVDKINQKFGLFDASGEIYVAYLERDNLHMATPFNFKMKIADRKIEVNGKLHPLADVWLEHPDRRIITEIGLWDTGKEPEGALNLYRGLAVQPVPCEPEDISFFTDFVRDDICRGNESHYTFLMDMLATKLQKPMWLPKICLVMRGGEGVGKGALTRVMENIIGPRHSVNVSSSENWLGTYSGTLMKDALWVSANEAHWSGNHSHGERLKALISEDSVDMQEKFVKARKQRNRVMIAITTNNEWAVPASHDSRRYFVLDVSDNRADAPDFWNEFNALMGKEDDGTLRNPEYLGKILYQMQNRKITSNLQRAMETEWLEEQRKESAIESRDELFVLWVRAVFGMGELPDDVVAGAEGENFVVLKHTDGRTMLRTENMYVDYRTYVNRRTRKMRMVYSASVFTDRLSMIGIRSMKVRKKNLMMGQRPMPGADVVDAKASVAELPSLDVIESNITKHLGLFAQDLIEEE